MMATFPSFPTPKIIEYLRQFKSANENIYLVGGAVRDLLLQRPIHDMDFVFTGDVRSLARKLANHVNGAFYMLDDQRCTARVIYSPEDSPPIVFDFAALRGNNLESDLRARDFSINAMALDLEILDQLIDPLGGARDLNNKVLRMCSDNSMKQDALRVLRAVRMSLNHKLKIQASTLQAIRQAAPLLTNVSAERQRDELIRMLGIGYSASAISLLDRFSVIPILFPEIQSLKGVMQSPPHTQDVWGHTLVTLQELDALFNALVNPYHEENASNLSHGLAVMQLGRFRQQMQDHFNTPLTHDRQRRSLLFLAALYHDSSKPHSIQIGEDEAIHFIHHATAGGDIIQRRAKALSFSNEEVRYLSSSICSHLRPHELALCNDAPNRREIYRYFRSSGEAGVGACLLSLADTLATYRSALPQDLWEKELQTSRELLEAWWNKKQEVIHPRMLINGSDLIQHFNLTPGPLIGQLLADIRENQAAGEIKNKESAVKYSEDWLIKH
jgi:tRNA nucleotidyltransferase/poly(A) polymerase